MESGLKYTEIKKYDDLMKYIQLPKSFSEAHFKIREDIGDDIFLLSNGDLGVIYEIPGIYDEPLEYEDLASEIAVYYKFLRQIISGVPLASGKGNIVCQLICSQRPVYEPPQKIDNLGNEIKRTTTEISKILTQEENKLFEVGLFKRKFYMAIRYEIKGNNQGVIETVKDFKSSFFSEEKLKNKFKARIERNKTHFINSLKPLEQEIVIFKNVKRITKKELFDYYHDVLHAGNGNNLLFCDDDVDLEKNIYNPDMSEEKGSGIVCNINGDKHEINSFVISQFPKKFAYGLFRNFIDHIPVEKFDICLCLSKGEQETNLKILGQMLWFANSPKYESRSTEIKNFNNKVSSMNPSCKMSLRITTYDIKEEEIIQMQSKSLDYLGARLVQETQIATHMISTSLPLNCSSYANTPTGRYMTTTLDNAMGFLPIYDGPTSDHGVQWIASRAGTPTRCDLFAGEGNRLTTILGTTRAGKSCLTSQIIMMFLEKNPDGVIRIIDKKCSYQKLCDLFNGKVVNFSYEHLEKHPYSPFALKEWTVDDIEVILGIIKTVISLKNPAKEYSAIHEEILKDGIVSTFNSYYKNIQSYETRKNDIKEPTPYHPIWEDFHSYIASAAEKKGSSNNPDIMKAKNEIIEWTYSLQGQYGFIFNRHEAENSMTSNAKILAYDLDGLPDEQTELICSQIAFSKILRDFLSIPRNVPKLLICDEFGMFLKAKSAQSEKMNKEFVAGMAQTAAKLNVQMMTITNAVSDYGTNVIGRIIWDLASQRIFLPHSNAMVKSLKDVFKEEFTDADYDIIASLKISHELKQSQCYVMCDTDRVQYKATWLLPLTPRMDAILTTSGSQVQLYKELKNSGLSAWDAINFMVKNHPYGEGLSRDNRDIVLEQESSI